jgi:hypothetical protein
LSYAFPTIESFNNLVYNDHALRGALEGLSVGAAAMLWHWRTVAWLVGLAGPALMFWSHVMWNYFIMRSSDPSSLLTTLRDVLDRGRLPLEVLFFGAIAAVVAELLILRWVAKRDRLFPPLPFARLLSLIKQLNTKAGLAELVTVERYLTLRRAVYYSGWQRQLAGEKPILAYADYARLNSLAARLGLRQVVAAPPAAATTGPPSVAAPAAEAAVSPAPAADVSPES